MSASLAGQIRDFDLPQVISLLEYGRMTGHLRVAGPSGNGVLAFEDGRLVGAECVAARGELAAILLLGWTDGTFAFSREPVAIPATTVRSNQSLVLEAARLLDDSRNPRLAFAPVAPLPPAAVNGARRIYHALQGATGIQPAARAIGLPPLEALFLLEELEGLGCVARCQVGDEPEPAATGTSPQARKVRVLVVDDSPLMQRALARVYESDPELAVVGFAANGAEAIELLPRLKPDVISLDLFMPVMDGPTTLKRIMLQQPTPTVVVTSANAESLEVTFESILRFGAIEFVTKPARSRGEIGQQVPAILARIRKAARVNLRGVRMVQPPPPKAGVHATRSEPRGIVVAAAGTGGGLSFMQLLTGLPADLPFAVVGLLPLPEEFLSAFIAYMRRTVAFFVEPAVDGMPLQGGVCYLASGERELRLTRGAHGAALAVGAASSLPGASALMVDAAQLFGASCVGLVMSGEGDETLAGLAGIRSAGGVTLAQLPASCVDPDAPERAIESGIVDRVVLPGRLSGSLSELLMARSRHDAEHEPKRENEPWLARSS